MRSVLPFRRAWQLPTWFVILLAPRLLSAADPPLDPAQVVGADAKTQSEMKPYTDVIAGADVAFDMLPIAGGRFTMGSPDAELGHQADESPRREVEISPFWMGKYEVTWDEFDIWTYQIDIQRREQAKAERSPLDRKADAVTRPTAPYVDMTSGMGKEGYPAVAMTQAAARTYCKWLSAKTGRFYRLPTEAEWEYACRAGSTTAYSFGNDPRQLGDYAWHEGNSGDAYHKGGQKKPNPWGLYDMHGNVAEWTFDQYSATGYPVLGGKLLKDPLVLPDRPNPRAIRGGAWSDAPEKLRSAARLGSTGEWNTDPNEPPTRWYLDQAPFLGFRLVRPLVEPSQAEKSALWEPGEK